MLILTKHRGEGGHGLGWYASVGLCAFAVIFCVIVDVKAEEKSDESAVLAESDANAFGVDILNQAIERCQRGDAEQALVLFKAIREQLEPPASVRQLLDAYEVTGCKPTSVSKGRWGLQLGFGGDSNVNQGISASTLTLGSGDRAIEVELGDVYRPKSSLFALAGIDRAFALGNWGTGQLALQSRVNQAVPELNLTSVVAGATLPFPLLDRPGVVQLDLGATWLGSRFYQQASAATLQWLPSKNDRSWVVNLATVRATYPTQRNQDSHLYEAGIWRESMVAPGLGIFGGVSALYDYAINHRGGGDRAGWRYQLGASANWARWQIQPRVSVLNWRSEDVFSPGLIDVVRQHRLAALDVQFIRPISINQQVILEWKTRMADDTVPLYSFKNHTLAIYWRYQL